MLTLNILSSAAAAAESLQSGPTLCNPIDGSPPGSPVPGTLQARTLEWVAISFSMHERKSESEVTQLCPTLRDPMDYGLPGFSIHGIFQARVLEWVPLPSPEILSSGASHIPLSNLSMSRLAEAAAGLNSDTR